MPAGKYCFGIEDTLKALEMGAVETLVVYENLDTMRYTLKNAQTDEVSTIHLSKEGEADQTNFVTGEGVELEVVEKMQLVEWFAQNYKNFGATLEFVTNRSQEGSQFVKGFGGIGGASSCHILPTRLACCPFVCVFPGATSYAQFLMRCILFPSIIQSMCIPCVRPLGILRYKVDFMEHEFDEEDDDQDAY